MEGRPQDTRLAYDYRAFERVGGWRARLYFGIPARWGHLPTLYDGHMNAVVEFPSEGYAVHADLWGDHTEQVIIYSSETASIYSSMPADLSEIPSGIPLSQPKRLSCSTLYPGGEVPQLSH